MRVLVIVNAKFGYDGISNVVTNYYLHQNHQFVEMDFCTINPIPSKLKEEIENNRNFYYLLECRNKNPLKYVGQLIELIYKRKYDIVHIHGNSSTMVIELLAAFLGGAKIRIAHSHNTRCNHPFLNTCLRPLFSILYTNGCACSKEAGRFLFQNRKFRVIKNGIPVENYLFDLNIRNKMRKILGVENKLVIGNIGRFSYQKNHELLLKIFKKVKMQKEDTVLLLIGEGELFEKIKLLAKKNGLLDSVIFYGTSDEIGKLVQAMDVFVFPSRFEGLGIAVIEAETSGVPCIISDTVPRAACVTDYVKVLPLTKSVELWSQTVISAPIDNLERLEKRDMIKRQIRSAGYDIEKNCEEVYRYYSELLNNRRKSI